MDNNKLNDILGKSIQVAYNKTDSKLYDTQCALKDKHGANFEKNQILFNMYSKLILETGRFSEQSASDLIIHIKNLEKFISDITADSEPELFLFGIHKNGVDNNKNIQNIMLKDIHNSEHFSEYYRRIYAIKVSIGNIYGLRCLSIEMKDMTSSLPLMLYELSNNENFS